MGCEVAVLSMVAGVSYLFSETATDGDFEQPGSAQQRKRDTKLVGDISELRVMAALTLAGYVVSKPFGENARYDLIADDGSRLQRVQVKTGRIRGGVIMFNCCSTHGHRRTEAKTRSYAGQIDLLAVFCPQNGKVYVLPESQLTRSKIQLRLSAPRNNMVKSIRYASWYELA